jgi:cohesin complex subunit SA-1/2
MLSHWLETSTDQLVQMVCSAIEVLAFHVLWKSKRLSGTEEPTAEEAKLRESLETERNQLMERLVGYAVGTQSNTADSVKRTVSV